MMMREQQWDRSNCRHFRIDVCLHQRIYMRAFVNARNKSEVEKSKDKTVFALFSGSKDANGASWCPDCVTGKYEIL